MTLLGKSLIAGRWSDEGGPPFRAFDPSAGADLDPEFAAATPADVEAAAKAAAAAFEVYRRLPGAIRAALMEAVAAEIEGLGDALLDRCGRETGLPAARLRAERARTTGQLHLFAALAREGSWVDARIDPAQPDRAPVPRPDLRRMLLPLGPVAVFGASNFPLAFSVAGGDTASALAAGCTVVAKAHPAHPGTCELVGAAVARAVAEAGLPAGVFSLLQGGRETGEALVRHPEIAAVGFTGSHAAGRALFDLAAARPRPIPVFAEMSSVNPVFLLPGALRERGPAIAAGLAASFTLGTGQFCTKPGLVFLRDGPDAETFCSRLAVAVRAAAPAPMLTAGIHSAFEIGRARMTAASGVRELARGPGASGQGVRAVPSVARVSAADFAARPELALEVFGPATLVVAARSDGEIVEAARGLDGQLTATIHGSPDDLRAARPLVALLERRAGRLIVNGFPTGVEVSPAMQHGGPYPATSDARFTSVGTASIFRFARPVCFQDFPADLLPDALRDDNPLGLTRLVDGRPTRAPVA